MPPRHINKISLSVEWQRRGVGRRLILRALRDGPDYTWVTSGQSSDAKKFFPVISAETGIAFTEYGPGCPHMAADQDPRVPPTSRPPKAVVERDI